MAGEREHVAIFNPLTLALPTWHPDGPDGTVDGYVIPFVFVEQRQSGPVPNRRAMIRVYPTEHGWRGSLRNCQDHAETGDQARAFAAAWIRAAELLDAEALRIATEKAKLDDGDVVDAEVVEDDDEDQDQSTVVLRSDTPVRVLYGEHAGREGRIESSTIKAGSPIEYRVMLRPSNPGMRGFETVPITDGALEVLDEPVRASCPACSAGTCQLHGEASK